MYEKQGPELLEALLAESGCTYLSDLHATQFAQAVREAVERIDPEAYALSGWVAALRYIGAQDARAEDAEAARQQLLDVLRQREALYRP